MIWCATYLINIRWVGVHCDLAEVRHSSVRCCSSLQRAWCGDKSSSGDKRAFWKSEGMLQFMSLALSQWRSPFCFCSKLTVFAPPAQQQGLLVGIHGQHGEAQLVKISMFLLFSLHCCQFQQSASTSLSLCLFDANAYKIVLGTLTLRAEQSRVSWEDWAGWGVGEWGRGPRVKSS